MAVGVILTELHRPLCGIDDQGNLVLGGSGNTDVTNTQGAPSIVGKNIPYNFAISYAPGGANIANVTFQLQDALGNNVARIINFDVWLSDAATGIGLTATTASGGFAAASGGGTIIGTGTTSKMCRAQTNAAGAFILAITDTANTGFFPCAQIGDRPAQVGAKLVAANY
jgi:hypothetical protein